MSPCVALYQEISGTKRQRQIPPNENEAKEFWKELWEKEGNHNSEADWLKQVKNEMKDMKKQENVSLEKNNLSHVSTNSTHKCVWYRDNQVHWAQTLAIVASRNKRVSYPDRI